MYTVYTHGKRTLTHTNKNTCTQTLANCTLTRAHTRARKHQLYAVIHAHEHVRIRRIIYTCVRVVRTCIQGVPLACVVIFKRFLVFRFSRRWPTAVEPRRRWTVRPFSAERAVPRSVQRAGPRELCFRTERFAVCAVLDVELSPEVVRFPIGETWP